MGARDSHQEFTEVGVKNLLEADPRPTFVLDQHEVSSTKCQPVFCNSALRSLSAVMNALVTGSGISNSNLPKISLAGLQWNCFLVSERWKVLSSSQIAPQDNYNDSLSRKCRDSVSLGRQPKLNFDWTGEEPPVNLTEHVKLFREHDWSATSVGSMRYWPAGLRMMLNVLMADMEPASIFWGSDLIQFYNEPYIDIAGDKHPWLIGRPAQVAWQEAWSRLDAMFTEGRRTAKATRQRGASFFLKTKRGFEERYFSHSVLSLIGEDGEVVGFYQPVNETTQEMFTQQRMTLALDINRQLSTAANPHDFWVSTEAALESQEKDIPFALLYSFNPDSFSEALHPTENCICYLVGSVGLPKNTDALPNIVDVDRSDDGFAASFKEAIATGESTLLHTADGTLPNYLSESMHISRGSGFACESAVLYPLRPTNSQSIRCFLVLGLNKTRRYDDDYKDLIRLVCRQLTSAMASIMINEDELRKGQKSIEQAAVEKALLSDEILKRTRETRDLETRFLRVAELAPVGIFIFAPDGSFIYCNDKWFEMATHPKDAVGEMSWVDSIWPEDLDDVLNYWIELVKGTRVQFEFRFKNRNASPDDPTPFTWVLANAYPEMSDNGSNEFITGTLTDIHHQKMSEGDAMKRASDALEAKRQQENFVDMTSHEIRNPLNAILQCADAVVESLTPLQGQSGMSDIIESCLQAAETIVHCAHHQKRVVDDILVLSKLDSDLVSITPTVSRPVELLKHARKIFEVQSQKAEVDLDIQFDQSITTLGIDWVLFDASRVLQILINLIGNAIKFTSNEPRRIVSVRLGTYLERPSGSHIEGFEFIPSKGSRHQSKAAAAARTTNTSPKDQKIEDVIFLAFRVEDTGRGLSGEEKERLFKRFSQASPRTHVKYGGSGLGLFISRQLTEMQGGEIGIASKPRQGSIFAFYIKAYRGLPPLEVCKLPSSAAVPSLNLDAPVPPPEIDIATCSVLIVEDNLVNQRVLKKQLANIVRNVYVANHGLEALEFLRRTQYWTGAGTDAGPEQNPFELSLILMDVEMPVMNGLACIRRIREQEAQGEISVHIPVIAVTANARTEQMMIAKEAGMDEVITKPFRIPDLVAMIKTTLAKYGT